MDYFKHESSYVDDGCEIGTGTKIWHFSHISSNVKIGKNCKIGPHFQLWTKTNNVDCDFSNNSNIQIKYGNIIIGDSVWIGSNVIISPGIKVGNNSIIGAYSIVTNDVPDFAIVGGVPAKLIRYKNINI